MFVRIRWFLYGIATVVLAGFFVVRKARQMKARLDADGVARASASVAADGIERIGRRLQRSALRIAPEGGEAKTG